MIKVYGKIESLKKIRSILEQQNIRDFNSIKEIDQFLSNYNSKVTKLKDKIAKEVDQEIRSLETRKNELITEHNIDIERISTELTDKIQILSNRINKHQSNKSKSFLSRISSFLKIRYTKQQISKNKAQLHIRTASENHKFNSLINSINKQLQNYSSNRTVITTNKISPELQRLDFIKNVLEEINPLIAGAKGEHEVSKELERLSSDGILINDYSIKISPPIYYKKEKSKIHSIQLDHLLITQAGIFIIETKNWSKKSIENKDLRSPVNQVNRSSYALFRIINEAKEIHLKSHLWGEKQIPIRNLIVMINSKPNTSFKYVKVKTLRELNGYIEHFEPVFTKTETQNLSTFLLDKLSAEESFKSKGDFKFIKNRTKNVKTINDMYKK